MALAILLAFMTVDPSRAADESPPPNPQDLLREMAPMTSDECTPPDPPTPPVDIHPLEDRLFASVERMVADRLNRPVPAQPSEAEARARSALLEIERSSAEINKSWPADQRFHFEILALRPSILARLSYRDQAKIVLFGSFDQHLPADPGVPWRIANFADPDFRASEIDLFPLHRGPSGRPRFVARVWRSGCAGSIGEDYYGYQWSAGAEDSMTQIIKIEGAQGLDQSESKQVGKLRTAGKTIQLPYCFFSAVDTWDNPTLCAADSFDLSGDDPQFIGRIYNAPDLVVVNNAIQHAEAHDYRALRAYCASDAVARKLIRAIPPFLHADMLTTSKLSGVREKIVFEDGAVYFNLVKQRGAWRLESFRIAGDR